MDVTGDGKADFVTSPGFGGSGRNRSFNGQTNQPIDDFFAFDPNFHGGATVGGF